MSAAQEYYEAGGLEAVSRGLQIDEGKVCARLGIVVMIVYSNMIDVGLMVLGDMVVIVLVGKKDVGLGILVVVVVLAVVVGEGGLIFYTLRFVVVIFEIVLFWQMLVV